VTCPESGRLRAFVLSGPAETDGVASLLLSVFYGSLAQEDEAKEKALMRGHECLSSFWRPQGDLNPCRLRERQECQPSKAGYSNKINNVLAALVSRRHV